MRAIDVERLDDGLKEVQRQAAWLRMMEWVETAEPCLNGERWTIEIKGGAPFKQEYIHGIEVISVDW